MAWLEFVRFLIENLEAWPNVIWLAEIWLIGNNKLAMELAVWIMICGL